MNKTYIGKIIGTFGIKGELKVYSESDFIDQRFKVGNEIILKSKKEELTVKVTSFRVHKNNVIISINNLNNINDVEKYLNYEIYSTIDLELKDNEYLVDDLIGHSVFNKDNLYLGKVKDVIFIPSHPILEIINEENKKTLIPFVKAYINKIDDEKIIINEVEML